MRLRCLQITPDEDDEELTHSAHAGDESQDAVSDVVRDERRGRHGNGQHETVDGERQLPPNTTSSLT